MSVSRSPRQREPHRTPDARGPLLRGAPYTPAVPSLVIEMVGQFLAVSFGHRDSAPAHGAHQILHDSSLPFRRLRAGPGFIQQGSSGRREGRIRLKRNPVLISAMMSAVTETDRWDNKWLSKQRAINKIDAAVALCMAVGAAMAGDTSGSIDDWLKSLHA